MNWYYAKDGQQAGPIDDAELSRLISLKAIVGSTLVWREGMAQWQPYQEVWTAGMPDWRTSTPSGTPPGITTQGPVTPGVQTTSGPRCTECKIAFAEDDLVLIEGLKVCAICKPTLLQRLKEGGFSRGTFDTLSPDALVQASQARNRTLNAMDCLEQSWAFFKREPGLALATVIVAYVVMFVGGVIPFLNWIIGLAINGPLMAGMWLVFVRSLRGESMSVGDVFKGFSTAWIPLVLVNLLTTVLVVLAFLPGFIPLIYFAIIGRLPNLNPGEVAVAVCGVLLFLPAVIYLTLAWIFAFPLVIDRNYGAWEAMTTSMRVVNRNLWPLLLLGLLCLACYVLGMLALCVGVLVAGPVIMGALAAAYEELLGSGVNRR